MNLKAFLERYGHDALHQLAEAVDSSYVYLRQIAYGHRKPSPAFARELESHSAKVAKKVVAKRVAEAKKRIASGDKVQREPDSFFVVAGVTREALRPDIYA